MTRHSHSLVSSTIGYYDVQRSILYYWLLSHRAHIYHH